MNRLQLQQLADERVRDAAALLAAGQWSGAYYMVGYAVECGLKACIAKRTNQYDFPDKEFAQKCFTHKIDTLVELAGLAALRKADLTANPALAGNWLIVKDWDEKSRYQLWTESEARGLFAAVTDSANGVLPWITGRW